MITVFRQKQRGRVATTCCCSMLPPSPADSFPPASLRTEEETQGPSSNQRLRDGGAALQPLEPLEPLLWGAGRLPVEALPSVPTPLGRGTMDGAVGDGRGTWGKRCCPRTTAAAATGLFPSAWLGPNRSVQVLWSTFSRIAKTALCRYVRHVCWPQPFAPAFKE